MNDSNSKCSKCDRSASQARRNQVTGVWEQFCSEHGDKFMLDPKPVQEPPSEPWERITAEAAKHRDFGPSYQGFNLLDDILEWLRTRDAARAELKKE